MKDFPRNASLFTGFFPGFVKLLDPVGAVAIEENPGQQLAPLVEHPLAKFPLLGDDLFFFIIEVGDPGIIVFRLPGSRCCIEGIVTVSTSISPERNSSGFGKRAVLGKQRDEFVI